MIKVLDKLGIAKTRVEHMETLRLWKDSLAMRDWLKTLFLGKVMSEVVIFFIIIHEFTIVPI